MSWMRPDKYERSQSSTHSDLIFCATGRRFDTLSCNEWCEMWNELHQ